MGVPAMREMAKSALKAVGLLDTARAILRAARSRGLAPWTPLVPAGAFSETCALAIRTLKDEDYEFGDYLEFGVSRGTSMACMHAALREAGLGHVRAIGFDSFEGLPQEAQGEGWIPG